MNLVHNISVWDSSFRRILIYSSFNHIFECWHIKICSDTNLIQITCPQSCNYYQFSSIVCFIRMLSQCVPFGTTLLNINLNFPVFLILLSFLGCDLNMDLSLCLVSSVFNFSPENKQCLHQYMYIWQKHYGSSICKVLVVLCFGKSGFESCPGLTKIWK